MPTLLKNSAAEGYAMGLGAHLKELDRTEAARQADLDRYQAIQANKIRDMINSYDPKFGEVFDQEIETPDGKKSIRNFIITDPYQAALQSAVSNRFHKKDERGNVSERGYTTIYGQDKDIDMTENSNYKRRQGNG